MTALLPGAGAEAQDTIGGVGASTSSLIIDVDPTSAVIGGVDEDLVRDQAQLHQAPKDPGTSGT
jgi:hypothetical protein